MSYKPWFYWRRFGFWFALWWPASWKGALTLFLLIPMLLVFAGLAGGGFLDSNPLVSWLILFAVAAPFNYLVWRHTEIYWPSSRRHRSQDLRDLS